MGAPLRKAPKTSAALTVLPASAFHSRILAIHLHALWLELLLCFLCISLHLFARLMLFIFKAANPIGSAAPIARWL